MDGERTAELERRLERIEAEARRWRRLAALAGFAAAVALVIAGRDGGTPSVARQAEPDPKPSTKAIDEPLLRFGAYTINMHKVQYIEDGKLSNREDAEDSMFVKFDSDDDYNYIFLDDEDGDALREWLNRKVPNLAKFKPDA